MVVSKSGASMDITLRLTSNRISRSSAWINAVMCEWHIMKLYHGM